MSTVTIEFMNKMREVGYKSIQGFANKIGMRNEASTSLPVQSYADFSLGYWAAVRDFEHLLIKESK